MSTIINDINDVPDRAMIRAVHGTKRVHALLRAMNATKRLQDVAFRANETAYRRGEAKADPTEVAEAEKTSSAAYAAEQKLHALWRSMGYQDCGTHMIGKAIEWSF